MNFTQRLNNTVAKQKTRLCVGLDTDKNKIPASLQGEKYPIYAFNKALIDATHDLVAAYKPNSAFYEAGGSKGIEQLKMTIDYIKETYPEVLVFLDAKRADIGNTNKQYVEYAFGYLNADAITLHPYVGYEGVSPFLENADKGCIILCRTSNPGAKEIQDLRVGGETLYEVVAKLIADKWNKNSNCMLVVGATYPKEMGDIRKLVPDIPFLVPGVGAQGGDIDDVVKNGLTSSKEGIIISASRSVQYASDGPDFAEKAREEAQRLKDAIEDSVQKA